MPLKSSFVLFLAVDDGLFKTCFGQDDQWPCRLESLDENCSRQDLEAKLSEKPASLVIMDTEECPHFDVVKEYYSKGGSVVYFGIYGEFAAPDALSREFGVQWKFSGYTKYNYVLSETGKRLLGDAITEQQYSKSNLLHVPESDRILKPAHDDFDDYKEDCDSDEDDETIQEKYKQYQESLDSQVPMASHRNESGGRITYLGFVNGDGNIPKFVRALCCGTKVEA